MKISIKYSEKRHSSLKPNCSLHYPFMLSKDYVSFVFVCVCDIKDGVHDHMKMLVNLL